MAEFVVLSNNDGYRKYTIAAAEKAGAFVPHFRSSRQVKLFELHNSWPLNRSIELPFKSVWYRHCFDESVDVNESIYFLFYESFHMSFSKQYLKHLREKYPSGKLAFGFTNPADSYNLEKLRTVRKFYDAVLTFYHQDAEQYGLLYCDCDCFLLPTVEPVNEAQADLFFVGADKGRLDLLLRIFEVMTEAGKRCDFHIVGVPEEKQKYRDQIHYNTPIPYEEVLARVQNSQCVLEVLKDDSHYASIRTSEAIQYRRKLLTTNLTLNEQPFYRQSVMQMIQKAEDIDISFFNTPIDDTAFEDIHLGDFDEMKKFLMRNVRRIK